MLDCVLDCVLVCGLGWTVLDCVLADRASGAGRASSNDCELKIGDGIFYWCVES